jgi:hypothetical protein
MACIGLKRLHIWLIAAIAVVAFGGASAVPVQADATSVEAPLANSTGNAVGDVTADFSSGTLQVTVVAQFVRPDASYEVCITNAEAQALVDRCDPLAVLVDTPTQMLTTDGSGVAKATFSYPVVAAVVDVVLTNVADPYDTLSATLTTYVTQSPDTAQSS